MPNLSIIFLRNPRLIALAIALIVVSGSVALTLLPRMEDPRLVPRAARLIYNLPGANAERIESLVVEKIEEELKDVVEIKEIKSVAGANNALIGIELLDSVNEVEAANVWSRVRDKAEDARRSMPPGVGPAIFKEYDITANAVILGVAWEFDKNPNWAILGRLANQLKDKIDLLNGTEKSELFGVPEEEILVTIDAEAMTSLGLNAEQISNAIAQSDAKVSAGQLRFSADNILIEVAGELDTLKRVGQIPIQIAGNSIVELKDVARIEKTVETPMETKVLVGDLPGIAIGAQLEPKTRIDWWGYRLNKAIEEFESEMPAGIKLVRIFDQNSFVERRMGSLLSNIIFGACAVFAVVLVMMGWRAAFVVGTSLPLVSFMVLGCMHWMEIPIHQMSITGLIIALGLMIDNAIVIVDEIASRIKSGCSKQEAVRQGTSFLFLPLLGSTLTTILSFAPIILMQGPSGEFVGSIAVVAATAVACSFVLATTIVAALAGFGLPLNQHGWLNHGISIGPLTRLYRWVIRGFLHNPVCGVLVGVLLPILGFLVAFDLPEQFFPPSERKQFQVELELPSTATLAETEKYARQVTQLLKEDSRVHNVDWFLGESALMFYYNVIPTRVGEPQYAQALVDCEAGLDMGQLVKEKQELLARSFPKAMLLARQFEQGPPFDAPVEIEVTGPDTSVLRRIGDDVRKFLIEMEHVHLTRASFSEPQPKISFDVDEQEARLAGFDRITIARRLNSALEGTTGGSILESTEELPVRVRVSDRQRQDIDRIASLDLLPSSMDHRSGYGGVPLTSISEMKLEPEYVRIERVNGVRMNDVEAFITPGVLPDLVLADFKRKLKEIDYELPPGYKIGYGGAEEERDEAVGALLGNVFLVVVMMVATLILAVGSFRLAALLFVVAGLSIGLGLGGLYLAGYAWGFMSVVAIMGMIGIAVNDSIVVLAAIRDLPADKKGDLNAIAEKIVGATRHILSTTFTTIVGFAPLFLFGGEFWSPVAIAISAGVGGATILAFLFVPCGYILLKRPRNESENVSSNGELDEPWNREEWASPDAAELGQPELAT